MTNDTKIAESVSEKLNFTTLLDFLVKPLDPIMVKKEFTVPIPASEKPKKDENGVEATDYSDVKTEVKEVPSDYRKGIVLKVPYSFTRDQDNDAVKQYDIKIGDTIIFRDTKSNWFDLVKDSRLVRMYEIIAVEHGSYAEDNKESI